jgi:ABC-type phosphate transport system permease subunit
MKNNPTMNQNAQNWKEPIVTITIRAAGYSAILFVASIFIFLLMEGLPALRKCVEPILVAVGTQLSNILDYSH